MFQLFYLPVHLARILSTLELSARACDFNSPNLQVHDNYMKYKYIDK